MPSRAFLAHAPRATARIGSLRPGDPEGALDLAERALAEVRWFDPASIGGWLVSDPFHAAVALALLADRPHTLPGERIAEIFPELAGLAVPTAAATHEHEASTDLRPTPLLDHVFRALRHALSADRLENAGDRALLTTTLLFADVAKGGDEATRLGWLERLGVDGAVHNEDSAVILGEVIDRVLHGAAPFREEPRLRARALALTASTGLVGMRLRGEVGSDAFAPFHAFLRSEPEAREALLRVWSLVNKCDTAAVREGLWSDALEGAFSRLEREIVGARAISDLGEISLGERIARFRRGALADAAAVAEAERAVERLGAARARTAARMARCSVWYAEAALGALSLDASVRLVALVAGVADRLVDTSKPWHLDLLGIVPRLRDERSSPRTYPVRLLEALLAATPEGDLAEGKLGSQAQALVTFPGKKGREAAVAVRLDEGDEARALLTLLALYEHKAAAAFHTTLKALCDLYGLRKDDFDRVANEANYLDTMNAARSDKSRMIDFVMPGLVVEVGPGGGVVLDLLEARFGAGRVVGLDASTAVVEALQKRKTLEGKRWEIEHGDAFELAEIFGQGTVTTVVFCSVLHEIFSYVPWGEPPRRFQLGSVDAIVAAAFRALAPGGRVVIRDGVMPARAPRVVDFIDPAWREIGRAHV